MPNLIFSEYLEAEVLGTSKVTSFITTNQNFLEKTLKFCFLKFEFGPRKGMSYFGNILIFKNTYINHYFSNYVTNQMTDLKNLGARRTSC